MNATRYAASMLVIVLIGYGHDEPVDGVDVNVDTDTGEAPVPAVPAAVTIGEQTFQLEIDSGSTMKFEFPLPPISKLDSMRRTLGGLPSGASPRG